MNRIRHVTYTIKDNMHRVGHVTYTIKDNMNRVRHVTYTTKDNKCICLLKKKQKTQMLLIIGLFFWPTNLPLKNVGMTFSANKTCMTETDKP
jgi:hypothetical protein